MPEFVYYEIDQEAVTRTLRERLFTIPHLRMRPDPEGGGWLVRSPEPVQPFEGGRRVQEARWATAVAPRPLPPTTGKVPDLIARAWKVVPGSRAGELSRKATGPRRSGLQLAFGEGTGDAVTLSTQTPIPGGATRLSVELRSQGGMALGVEPSFRSPRGRPLATLEARSVSGPGRKTLDWSLPDLNEVERSRVAELSFSLSSEADWAVVCLDAIAFGA